MCPSDLNRVDTADGVQQVVGLINDHDVACQFRAHRLTGGRMQEGVVWQHNQLGRGNGISHTIVGARLELSTHRHQLLNVLDFSLGNGSTAYIHCYIYSAKM